MPDQSYDGRRHDALLSVFIDHDLPAMGWDDKHMAEFANDILRRLDAVTPDDHVDHNVLREMGIEPPLGPPPVISVQRDLGPLDLHEVAMPTGSPIISDDELDAACRAYDAAYTAATDNQPSMAPQHVALRRDMVHVALVAAGAQRREEQARAERQHHARAERQRRLDAGDEL